MPMGTLIIELRPKWLQLSTDPRYSEADVVDILCAFAQRMNPDMDPQEMRRVIIASFIEGRNEN